MRRDKRWTSIFVAVALLTVIPSPLVTSAAADNGPSECVAVQPDYPHTINDPTEDIVWRQSEDGEEVVYVFVPQRQTSGNEWEGVLVAVLCGLQDILDCMAGGENPLEQCVDDQ